MDNPTAASAEDYSDLLSIECRNGVIVVTPLSDLGEFAVNRVEKGAEQALTKFQETHDCRHVVVDFCRTDYFGSSALGLFVRLWKRVRQRQGRMAMCNLSKHESEVLKITRLDEFWAICDTLEEATASVLEGD